jgi:hypothetical protein
VSHISSEKAVNSLACEAAELVRQVSPPAEGLNIKGRINRASRRLGWSFNRARDVWNKDPRISIRGHEIEALRTAARGNENKAAADELNELRERIARLEALLARTGADPDRARSDLDRRSGGDRRGNGGAQDRAVAGE